MRSEMLNSQSDTQRGIEPSVRKFTAFHSSSSHSGTWYERLIIASLLSYSISSYSVICGFTSALAGIKAIIVLPAGTSRGTSRVIRRSAGISMVWVIVIN